MAKGKQISPEEAKKQNEYAYMLSPKFTDAINEFANEHRDATPTAILGATNITCMGVIVQYSRDRKEAERMLEENIKVMRNLLAHTPDFLIGNQRQIPNGLSNLGNFQS